MGVTVGPTWWLQSNTVQQQAKQTTGNNDRKSVTPNGVVYMVRPAYSDTKIVTNVTISGRFWKLIFQLLDENKDNLITKDEIIDLKNIIEIFSWAFGEKLLGELLVLH